MKKQRLKNLLHRDARQLSAFPAVIVPSRLRPAKNMVCIMQSLLVFWMTSNMKPTKITNILQAR